MQDGWFVLLMVVALILLGGALLVSWLLRTNAARREDEALNAADLRLLEDSVLALVDRLKAASDEAVAEITARQERLQALLDRADAVLGAVDLPRGPEGERDREGIAPDALPDAEVRRLADEGIVESDIARRAGLSRGEVELILGLQAARR